MFFFASRKDHHWFDNQPSFVADLEDPRTSVLVGDSVQVNFLIDSTGPFEAQEYQDNDIDFHTVSYESRATQKLFHLSIPFTVRHREYIIHEDDHMPGYFRGLECFITLEAASDVGEQALLRLLDLRSSTK